MQLATGNWQLKDIPLKAVVDTMKFFERLLFSLLEQVPLTLSGYR